MSVITGFLGSGKTTLLSRLLADARMNKAAVIINEFGEVGLDHMLVTAPREDVVLLSSGCLCCSLRGDLVNTLSSLWNERARGEIPEFDRVLVETTGLADPAPVLLTVTADEQLAQVFHVERVITTVDAVHGLGQLDSQPESVKQACVADVILLTKTDIADAETVAALRARLQRLNPIALTARRGARRDRSGLAVQSCGAGAAARARFSRAGRAGGDTAIITATSTTTIMPPHRRHQLVRGVRDEPVTFAGLELWMGMLGEVRGPSLLRIKGIVNVGGRPIVIQARAAHVPPAERVAGLAGRRPPLAHRVHHARRGARADRAHARCAVARHRAARTGHRSGSVPAIRRRGE